MMSCWRAASPKRGDSGLWRRCRRAILKGRIAIDCMAMALAGGAFPDFAAVVHIIPADALFIFTILYLQAIFVFGMGEGRNHDI